MSPIYPLSVQNDPVHSGEFVNRHEADHWIRTALETRRYEAIGITWGRQGLWRSCDVVMWRDDTRYGTGRLGFTRRRVATYLVDVFAPEILTPKGTLP